LFVLAIDTTLEACSASLLKDGVVLARRSEPMQRGHQERLAVLVDEVVRQAHAGFHELDRIGVTTGPGSFTGLRVGLAFARGLALALGVPCVGLGTLEALAASAPSGGWTAAAVDARRGQIYLQIFHDGRPHGPPEALETAAAIDRVRGLGSGPVTVVGSAAPLLKTELGHVETIEIAAPDPVAVARLAAAAPEPAGPPSPIYLRAPDARLPA
jgi:tRNA threonylcarbamoyladenosine biosynthesis protein TsaB